MFWYRWYFFETLIFWYDTRSVQQKKKWYWYFKNRYFDTLFNKNCKVSKKQNEQLPKKLIGVRIPEDLVKIFLRNISWNIQYFALMAMNTGGQLMDYLRTICHSKEIKIVFNPFQISVEFCSPCVVAWKKGKFCSSSSNVWKIFNVHVIKVYGQKNLTRKDWRFAVCFWINFSGTSIIGSKPQKLQQNFPFFSRCYSSFYFVFFMNTRFSSQLLKNVRNMQSFGFLFCDNGIV